MEVSFQQTIFKEKTRLIGKLFAAGCVTEKQLLALDMESCLRIPGITIPELKMILDMQKMIKANRLYSYLGGERAEGE